MGTLSQLWKRLLSARMLGWALLTAVLFSGLAVLAPQQVSVVMSKVLLLTLAAWLAYWLDRSAFPYARPHEYFTDGHYMIGAMLMLRRALVMLGAMIVIGLGL